MSLPIAVMMNNNFIRTLLLLFVYFFAASLAFALDIPKDFEASQNFGNEISLWIQPKTFETIHITKEKLDGYEVTSGNDPYNEIKETVEAKSRTLSWILNIKNWKIVDSMSKTKDGSQLIIFFGSYTDSSDQLTMFAEVYWLPKNAEPKSYLFTRYKQAYTAKELAQRFKLELP